MGRGDVVVAPKLGPWGNASYATSDETHDDREGGGCGGDLKDRGSTVVSWIGRKDDDEPPPQSSVLAKELERQ